MWTCIKRTPSNDVLSDKEINISKNLKYDGYECGLVSIV